MPKILKIILVMLLFISFFEAGLISSYTIVTSEVPDIKGLVDLQVETIFNLFSTENINEMIIKDPVSVNISNKIEVANTLTSLAKIDGVNIDSINATTYQNLEDDNLKITITALGYESSNVTSGQIVLSQNPDYKVVATANGKLTEEGIEIDIKSIRITSVLNLYDSNST